MSSETVSVPAWTVFRSREEYGGDLPLLSLSAEHGVRLRGDKEGRAASEDLGGYRVVRQGDIVINRLSARDGAVARSQLDGLVSPAYWVLVAEEALSSRFAHYLLRSHAYLSEIARVSKWMPPAQFDLPWHQFRRIRLLLPSVPRQVAIADVLDAETMRVAALAEKKRHLIKLLEERKSLLLVSAMEAYGFRWGASLESPAAQPNLPAGWRVAHLSTVLEKLTNGYVGPTRDILVDDGVRYIQSLHIKDGEIDFERGPYYVPPEWHDERPRIHLRPGDVLIVQTGDIGQVAVVPTDFGPASCHALQIARVRRDLLVGEYLGAYLRSPFGRNSLLSRVTGALHPHLEGGIRDIPIVVPPLHVQNDLVADVRDRSAPIDRLRFSLEAQIELLREHRQALITVAVSGQLDVSKVAAA